MSEYKLLLITSNLGSIFEMPGIEKDWIAVMEKAIIDHDPSIVAIHCQEIGGKEWTITMPKVEKFISKFRKLPCFSQFNRVRGFIDTQFKEESFTALGNIYFVHQRIPPICLWNFHTQQFQEVKGDKIEYGILKDCQFIQKDKFPNHYFPDVKWSRKGFLRTRWHMHDGQVFNLTNIHLFHDEDNLIALEKSPSVYAGYRRTALEHTIKESRRHTDSADEPLFIFGDFNFRLDFSAVLKHIARGCQQNFLRNELGQIDKVVYQNCDCNVWVARKKVGLKSVMTLFTEKYQELLQFDKELSQYDNLMEEAVNFQPSYPFSEDLNQGKVYLDKRCPAWCDRILMNKGGKDLLEKTQCPRTYNVIGKDVCVGDHKPICLAFTLQNKSGTNSTLKD